jgi:hypothetical protein
VRSSKRDRWFRDRFEASNRGPPLTNWKPPSEWVAYLRSGKPRRSFAARLPRDKGSAAVGYPGRSGRETKATGSQAATDMINRLVLRRAKPKHTAATSAAKPEKKNPPPGAPPEPAGAEGAEGPGESLGSLGFPGAPLECPGAVVAPLDRPEGSFTGGAEESGLPKTIATSASFSGLGEATGTPSGDGPKTPRGSCGEPGGVGSESVGGGTVSVGGGTVSVGGGTVSVGGGTVSVGGGTVSVGGGTVSVGGGTVSVGGGTVSVGGADAGSVVEPDVPSAAGDSSTVGVGTPPALSVAVAVPPSGVSVVSSARLVAAKTSASVNEAAKSASPTGRRGRPSTTTRL